MEERQRQNIQMDIMNNTDFKLNASLIKTID